MQTQPTIQSTSPPVANRVRVGAAPRSTRDTEAIKEHSGGE